MSTLRSDPRVSRVRPLFSTWTMSSAGADLRVGGEFQRHHAFEEGIVLFRIGANEQGEVCLVVDGVNLGGCVCGCRQVTPTR